MSGNQKHKVESKSDWIKARQEFLERWKAFTRERGELSEARRHYGG